MSLSSIEFVALLPIVIAVYWLLYSQRPRHIYLVLVTALFVAFNGRTHLWVLLAVLFGVMAAVALASRPAWPRRRILQAAAAGLLLTLGYYKYLPWISGLLSAQVATAIQPIGISYYVFILIGFLLDASNRGLRLRASRLPWLVLFFPFILSGPIVRLRPWSAQLSRRKRHAMRNISIGAQLFLVGAAKKILIADAIAMSTAPVWADPELFSPRAIAIAVVGFYLQLYADFSGYTDMARGVARMMGFHLPINFKAPYYAATPSEFWNRWHISLTSWIRDYVFTPLSAWTWRRVRSRRLAPVVTVTLSVILMTLVGLWHGASNNFLLFGLVHGVLIGGWYLLTGSGRRLTGGRRVLSWLVFQLLLMLTLTMFRADTLGSALAVVRGTVSSAGTASLDEALIGLALAAAAVFALQRIEWRPGRRLAVLRKDLRVFPLVVLLVLFVLYMKGLTLEGVWISPADPFFNQCQEQFIYLKF